MRNSQDTDPRAYWTARMDEAFAFMEAMRTYPLRECGEEIVPLAEAGDGNDIQYSTTKINGTIPRVYCIRAGLVRSFQAIAREMNERGWILKVEDGYRAPETQRAQTHSPAIFDLLLRKVMWELDGRMPDPAFLLRRMSALVATRCRVGTHISGSAIDISVIDRETGNEIPRGGPYIEISERTPMDSPFITDEERQNRITIREILARHGWVAYPWEFWHFSSGDCYAGHLAGAGEPARYGPVRFDGHRIEPLDEAEADALLEPVEFYEAQIAAAQERLNR